MKDEDNTEETSKVELKRLLDLIERAKQEWELAVDSLSQVVCLLDREGHVLRANMTVEKWGLAQVTKVKGLEIHELLHPVLSESNKVEVHEFLHPACTDPDCYMGTLWPRVKEELAQGRPYEVEVKDSVLKRYLNIQTLPRQVYERTKSKTEAAFAVVIIEDVSARKQAEEALMDREKFLKHVLDSIQDGISILNKDMNIIRVNPTMEQWYSHAMPLVGKKCYEAYHNRSTSCEVCPSLQTLETGKATYEVVPKRGPSGKVVGWLELYSFPLFDTETGQLKGVIEYVRDITERKELEQDLKKKISELERFHKVVVGRELKMKELKERIKELEEQLKKK